MDKEDVLIHLKDFDFEYLIKEKSPTEFNEKHEHNKGLYSKIIAHNITRRILSSDKYEFVNIGFDEQLKVIRVWCLVVFGPSL